MVIAGKFSSGVSLAFDPRVHLDDSVELAVSCWARIQPCVSRMDPRSLRRRRSPSSAFRMRVRASSPAFLAQPLRRTSASECGSLVESEQRDRLAALHHDTMTNAGPAAKSWKTASAIWEIKNVSR